MYISNKEIKSAGNYEGSVYYKKKMKGAGSSLPQLSNVNSHPHPYPHTLTHAHTHTHEITKNAKKVINEMASMVYKEKDRTTNCIYYT